MPIADRARDGQLTFNLDEYRLACVLNLACARPERCRFEIEIGVGPSIENWIRDTLMPGDRLLINCHFNREFINVIVRDGV